jgi:hypothetical protein
MALQMTFDRTPCPSLWGYISNTTTDLGNALINDASWDWNTLYSTLSPNLPKTSLPLEFPFKLAKPLSVSIPFHDKGKADIYIDDFIMVAPDLGNSCLKVYSAILLAI